MTFQIAFCCFSSDSLEFLHVAKIMSIITGFNCKRSAKQWMIIVDQHWSNISGRKKINCHSKIHHNTMSTERMFLVRCKIFIFLLSENGSFLVLCQHGELNKLLVITDMP